MHKNLLILLVVIFSVPVFAQNLETFDIDRPFVKAVVEEGEGASFTLSIANGNLPGRFNIESQGMDFFEVSPSQIDLGGKEIAEISLSLGNSDLTPGVYVGSLLVKNELEEVVIPVVLEVESPSPSFDVAITEVPSVLKPGEYFKPEVTVYNLRSLDSRVEIEYFVYNLKGEIVHNSMQVLNVENDIKFVYNILIPEDLAFGEYIMTVVARDSTVGTTSSQVSVGDSALYSPPESSNNYWFFIGLIVILLVAFLILNYYWNRKLNSSAKYWDKKVATIKKKKVREVKVKNTGAEIHKLEHQASLLRTAYSKGYIKKESFDEGITKINGLIKQLKKRL